MAVTYDPIATTTLGGSGSIAFSSIPSTYTDLRVVLTALGSTAGITPYLRFNSDTATNYSTTYIYGEGTQANSASNTSITALYPASFGLRTAQPFFYTYDIFSYAGSAYKTTLMTSNEDNAALTLTPGFIVRTVGLWRSTSAITSIGLSTSSGSFAAGTTATLYGILKA
jgi:hypothetical protein